MSDRSAFRAHIADNYHQLPRPAPLPVDAPSFVVVPTGTPFLPEVAIPAAPSAKDKLPEFKTADLIIPGKIKLPELLIDGILHRGCKLMLSGGSKSFKSWVLMDMGISVAHGIPWWGLNCRKGKTLFLNFELIDGFFEERLISICRARNVAPPKDFIYWNLRGYCYDLHVLAQAIVSRLALHGPFDLIVIDPIYKALGDLDENAASDMNKLMNLIESITVQTGASVVFGSHFSKGNQSSKEAKDRPSGSGVLIRDPDAILVMTRHEQEHCYVVSSELRYLQPMSEFVVRWNFPIMQADESLDPRQLYNPAGDTKNKKESATDLPAILTEKGLLDVLPESGVIDAAWRRLTGMAFGKIGPEFYAIKTALLQKGHVVKEGQIYRKLKFELKPN